MRIVATADLHGHLPKISPCDLLIIAGDLCPLDDHNPAFQAQWLTTVFSDWLRRQPAERVAFIAGNHDFVCQSSGFAIDQEKFGAYYLEDSGLEIAGLKLWGTPWLSIRGDWAFNANPEQARERFALIPDDTDVVISHAPIAGVHDQVAPGLNVGSGPLASRIESLAPPLLISGHIHECAGQQATIGATTLVNAGLVNKRCQPAHAPLIIDLAKNQSGRWAVTDLQPQSATPLDRPVSHA
jgi:Icc-related predicted phosphoesterase